MLGIKWDLLFVITGCLKLASLSDCYSVHISADAEPGTVIANLGQSGTCALDQVIAPKFTKTFVETDAASRVVFISGILDCATLSSNPFTVYVAADCKTNVSGFRHLLTSRYDVHVHGRNCFSKHKRKTKLDVDVISLLQVHSHQPACYKADAPLFHVADILPDSPAGSELQCSVTGDSLFYFSAGGLFVSERLCLKHSVLLELDLHCNRCVNRGQCPGAGEQGDSGANGISMHLRIGVGSFKQEYLEGLLQVAAQSEVGIVSRSKRNVNTSPQFQPPMYQVAVPENKPAGTSVVLLKAVDADEGEAGRLTYVIEALFDSRSNSLFAVDPASGAVTTVEVLDRETKDTHVFRVTAVDHGTPRRTAMATLTITVSDTNDHDPVFEQQDYKESVRENLEIGYEVLTVRATDGDSR